LRDITRNVEQASNGTGRVSKNIATVSDAAGATRPAAQDVLSATGELSMQSEHLGNEVQGFLERVSEIV